MRALDILQTAGSNLLRNKTRTTLTIIAVFVGATTITLTNGMGDGIKSYLTKQIGSLGAENVLIISQKDASNSSDGPQVYDPTKIRSAIQAGPTVTSQILLTQNDITVIKGTKEITTVAPSITLTADYITTGKQKYIIDLQPARTSAITYDLVAGKSVDNASAEQQVLLPNSFVKTLGFASAQEAIGKPVTFAISNQLQEQKEYTATIVGVTNKSFVTSNSLITNKPFGEALNDYQNIGKSVQQQNLYSFALAEFNPNLTPEQLTALKDNLGDKGYSAVTIKDQKKTIFDAVNAVIMVLNLFGIVALAAASFGIINTLYMAVQERIKEIGLMKAVGMSKGKIFALFSIEAGLLGLIGSVLGVLAANGIGRVLNKVAAEGFLKGFDGLQLLSFKYSSVLVIIGVVTLIAFLAGTLPARKASKLDPIEALRYE